MPLFGIAVTSSTTNEMRNELTSVFSSALPAYWHWIDDFWIVRCEAGVTAKSLHEWIEKRTDITATMLVIEIKDGFSYWGRSKNEAWDWLSTYGSAK